MSRLINGVAGLLTLFYPLAVYFGVQSIQPWQIALLLALLLWLRSALGQQSFGGSRRLTVVAVLYCGLAVWNNDVETLRFYPALMNLGLLSVFAASLYCPPSIVERFARIQQPDLPPEGVIYTRRVTGVWCGFFLLNGTVSAATALWCSFEVWSLYNGLIAYLLIGLLMAIEYWIRQKTQHYVR
ncbi:MAG: hypothetical protein Kow0065_09710 [Methylomicrobium sp.]